MSVFNPEPGWSNSEPAANAPQDEYPDIQPFATPEPGFSNSGPPADADTEATADVKVVEPAAVEDKAVTRKTAAKKG